MERHEDLGDFSVGSFDSNVDGRPGRQIADGNVHVQWLVETQLGRPDPLEQVLVEQALVVNQESRHLHVELVVYFHVGGTGEGWSIGAALLWYLGVVLDLLVAADSGNDASRDLLHCLEYVERDLARLGKYRGDGSTIRNNIQHT